MKTGLPEYRHLTVLAVALALAFAVLGCNNSKTSVATGPTPVKCSVALTLAQASMDSSGGAGTVTVSSAPECAWTATSEASWITNLSPATGQGTGDILFQVAPNPSQASRQGDIVVNGVRAHVGQGAPACTISIAPASQAVAASGGSGTVHVSGATGCSWTATSNDPWLTVTSGNPGNGAGVVSFTAAANAGTVARVGTLTIANQTFTVAQPEPGAPPCSNAIAPTSQDLPSAPSNFTVNITATSACSWTAVSNVAWLAVVGVGSGVGNGSVTVSAAANTGTTRVGTATIAGQTLTVTQNGSCLATFAPTSASLTASAGSSSTAVTIAAGCAWTASTADSWITITSGASGNGNGTVAFSVTANTGSSRNGTLTIAGQSFSVTQAGSCVASLNPTSQSVASGAGSATVAVTVATGCSWTSSTSASWITITSGASGSGNGTVGFDVAANPNTTGRTGTITIAGQTHTVNQAGACPASINPTSQTVPSGGGPGTNVAVTIPSGCAWTASTATPWITITSGASGTGNGTVAFTTAANPNSTSRSGTITIAGQTHTVTQSGSCPSSIAPTSQTVSSSGGAGTTVSVTTPDGCAWTSSTTAPWITITGGSSGSGNGSVDFTVAANSGAQRVGTITIAGQTHTVTQLGSCAASINPSSQTAPAAGGAATPVAVTIVSGCAWTASTATSWITITGGASGTGNGTVGFTTDPNTGPQRVGTLTIAGQTHTVTQLSGCTFSINPAAQNLSKQAQAGTTITVTAGAGCAWTAVANDSWITVPTGSSSGTGNGTTTFSVAANNTGNPRNGTITIAGQTFTVHQDK